MTNIVATLIITTNTHWTLVEAKPSNYGCLVVGCRRDHSEMRIERKQSWRITQAQCLFDGRTTNFVLKCEGIESAPETRIQYSGVDYEKEPRLVAFHTFHTNMTWPSWTNNFRVFP